MVLFVNTWAGVFSGLSEWLTGLMDSPLSALSAFLYELSLVFIALAVWLSVFIFFPLAVIYLCSAIYESVKLLPEQGRRGSALKNLLYRVCAFAFVVGACPTSTVGEVSHALQNNVASTTSLMVVLMTFVVPYVCYVIFKKIRTYGFDTMSVKNWM